MESNRRRPTRLNGDAKEDLARRWLQLLPGHMARAVGKSTRGDVALLWPLDGKLRDGLLEILAERAGENAAAEIIDLAEGLDRFSARIFCPGITCFIAGGRYSGDSPPPAEPLPCAV